MLKFQKLDKRMNWHNTYSERVEFYSTIFKSEGKSSQEMHFMALDLFIKATKAMNETLGYGPSADLTFRYKEIYGQGPLWASRDAKSNMHGGNTYAIYVKSEAEKVVLKKILEKLTGVICN